ncbi:10460_t:CDS:2 [Entrophospora sp. SA101]|nr:10416_t:CDS:2 [Entrophospora sp. SA101]CAJ0641351.1 15150_t:CDS:2 [Entrophospora sp. SA101]CAJ0754359.1 13726_t:CDS:2 [Entrophospora sp. SA101]CAJ0758041.1 10460_t:CDS:2 [Entrophospora sp. SA101]CAJ0833436.1 9528_t:CDS:2 [Entrophospora sp. SA101]
MILVTEKSRDLCKWCILLCHGLISLSLNYLPPNDLKKYLHRIEHYNISGAVGNGGDGGNVEEVNDFDEKKAFKNEEKTNSSNDDEKKALIPSEKLLEKTSATLNIPPPISLIGQVLLKRCEKQSLDLKNRYRPAISSSLNPNRKPSPPNNKNNTGDDDLAKNYPSKRYSTLANSRPKPIYRFFNQKSNILEKASTDPDEYHNYTSSRRSSKNRNHQDDVSITGNKIINVGDDKNIRLDRERPTFRQQPRTSHTNITPAVTLQVSRKCLKIMVRIRRHRNTI